MRRRHRGARHLDEGLLVEAVRANRTCGVDIRARCDDVNTGACVGVVGVHVVYVAGRHGDGLRRGGRKVVAGVGSELIQRRDGDDDARLDELRYLRVQRVARAVEVGTHATETHAHDGQGLGETQVSLADELESRNGIAHHSEASFVEDLDSIHVRTGRHADGVAACRACLYTYVQVAGVLNNSYCSCITCAVSAVSEEIHVSRQRRARECREQVVRGARVGLPSGN